MPRRCARPDGGFDCCNKIGIQGAALGKPDKQDHPHVIVPCLADDKRLDDVIESLDLPVNLGCANPHSAGVQRCVRAPMNNDAAALGQRCPVTMPPDTGKMLEIGGPVFGIARIVPEFDRHRWEGGKTA